MQRTLQLVGRLHLPLLLANHAAIETEQPHADLRIDGKLWRLPAQRYKQKCLVWLQHAWQALPPQAQAQASIRDLPADSGCLDALAAPAATRVPVAGLAPL